MVEVDPETGVVAGEALLTGHAKRVLCLATAELEESGVELLLTGGEDCTAMLWRLQVGEAEASCLPAVLHPHTITPNNLPSPSLSL